MPSEKLLTVLYCFSKLVDIVLSKRRNLQHLKAVAKAAEVLREGEVFVCEITGHYETLLHLLLTKFLNYL